MEVQANMNKKLVIILSVVVVGTLVLAAGAAAGGAIAYWALRGGGIQTALAAITSNNEVQVLQGKSEIASQEGVLVSAVEVGGPAEEAGVVRGDILLEINGESLDSLSALFQKVEALKPGDQVTLKVQHGDAVNTLSVTLGDQGGRAYLGVISCDLPGGARIQFHQMPFGPGIENFEGTLPFQAGALVLEVVPDAPAEAAGLQPGDVITSVDGEAIGGETTLADLLQAHQPGDTVTLQVQRGDSDQPEELELSVKLAQHPDNPDQAYLGIQYRTAGKVISGGDNLPKGFPPEWEGRGGFVHPPLWNNPNGEPGFPQEPNLPEGYTSAAMVVEVLPGTPAETAGLQQGDWIVALDGVQLDNPDGLPGMIQDHKPGDKVTLTVIRNENETLEITVTLADHPENPEAGYLGVRLGAFIKQEIQKDNPTGGTG